MQVLVVAGFRSRGEIATDANVDLSNTDDIIGKYAVGDAAYAATESA